MHLRTMFHIGLTASAWACRFFGCAASFLPCAVLLCHPLASLFLIETGQWNNQMIFLHTSKWWFETGPPEVPLQQMKHHFNMVFLFFQNEEVCHNKVLLKEWSRGHAALSLRGSHLSNLGTTGLLNLPQLDSYLGDEYLPLALKGSYEWPMPQKV